MTSTGLSVSTALSPFDVALAALLGSDEKRGAYSKAHFVRRLLELFSAEENEDTASEMRERIIEALEEQESEDTFPQAASCFNFGGIRALELMRACSRRSQSGAKPENFSALLHHLAERDFGMIESAPQKMQLVELHAAMSGEESFRDDAVTEMCDHAKKLRPLMKIARNAEKWIADIVPGVTWTITYDVRHRSVRFYWLAKTREEYERVEDTIEKAKAHRPNFGRGGSAWFSPDYADPE